MSERNFVINHWFQVWSSPCVFLGKFALDAEVLDIGIKYMVLGLSWLKENGFVVDIMGRCLRNVDKSLVLRYSI